MTATVSAPRFEHHREALGIGESAPRLSWTIDDAAPEWHQSAYRVEARDPHAAADPAERAAERAEVASSAQILVAWPFAALRSRERREVRISVRGHDGVWSAPGPWAPVEIGLLDPSDWAAAPVGALWNENPMSDERRPSLVRREFDVAPGLVRARLYAASVLAPAYPYSLFDPDYQAGILNAGVAVGDKPAGYAPAQFVPKVADYTFGKPSGNS